MCSETKHNTPYKTSFKKDVRNPVHKRRSRVGFVFAQKTDPKSDALIGRFPEFGRSDRAEFLTGGRYRNFAANQRLDLPKDVRARCWIPRPKLIRILVQIQQGSGISEIAGDSSIGTRRNFCRVVIDLIPHNSTEVII